MNYVTVSLDKLNATLQKYQRVSGKEVEEVLAKQAGKLSFVLYRRLRGLAPNKGEIRASMLARLKAGGGIKVRDTVRQAILEKYSPVMGFGMSGVARKKFGTTRKGLNLQALMVKKEIGLRESGRGFLGISAKYGNFTKGTASYGSEGPSLHRTTAAFSRYGHVLSDVNVNFSTENKQVVFKWDSRSQMAAKAAHGMSTQQARLALNQSLNEVRQDIAIYLHRKTQEALRKVRN